METRATIKGQIVIPAALRRKYNIQGGTRIQVYEERGGSYFIRLPVRPFERPGECSKGRGLSRY
jgi:AbrB family looped-hinge helix DNA binding protein